MMPETRTILSDSGFSNDISISIDSRVSKDTSQNALVREGLLLWQGISAIPDSAREAFDSQHRQDTIVNASISAGTTFAFSCLKRDPAMAWIAGRVLIPALFLSSAKDLSVHAGNIGNALLDNWNSERNWNTNVSTMKNSIGRFGVDLAVSALAGGIAEAGGRSYFGLKAPGVNSLPALNSENVRANWDRHMSGELVPYSILSPEGGGKRQVDLFVPRTYEASKETGLLIGPDSTLLGFGSLKNLKKPGMALTNGLANLDMDPSIDYIAAFPHAKQFRVLPGVNMASWFHDSGLVTPGGWLAPKPEYSDVTFMSDLHNSLKNIFNTSKATIVGFSAGGMLGLETASRLGSDRVQATVSVASTVTGLEPAAKAGQFRLFVNDIGDRTFPIDGGAGGPSKILVYLGHDTATLSQPRRQTAYGLAPYAPSEIVRTGQPGPAVPKVLQRNYALNDGTPLVSTVELDTGAHGWPNRRTDHPEDTSVMTKINSVSKVDGFNLNKIIKEIVNGNLAEFSAPPSFH